MGLAIVLFEAWAAKARAFNLGARVGARSKAKRSRRKGLIAARVTRQDRAGCSCMASILGQRMSNSKSIWGKLGQSTPSIGQQRLPPLSSTRGRRPKRKQQSLMRQSSKAIRATSASRQVTHKRRREDMTFEI